MRAKKIAWNIAPAAPYDPIIHPIIGGLRFRPPISSGIARNSGNRALREMFKKARET
jgi:hypothetical protein